MVSHDAVQSSIVSIHDNTNSLDTMIQLDKFFDSCHLYVYDNWLSGELIDGPVSTRYWVEIQLMYPLNAMPDPDGGARLVKFGCKVYYAKEEFIDEDDAKYKVWVVKLKIPKRYVDDIISDKLFVDGDTIDMDEISAAYESGLDDETIARNGSDIEENEDEN